MRYVLLPMVFSLLLNGVLAQEPSKPEKQGVDGQVRDTEAKLDKDRFDVLGLGTGAMASFQKPPFLVIEVDAFSSDWIPFPPDAQRLPPEAQIQLLRYEVQALRAQLRSLEKRLLEIETKQSAK